MTILRTSRLTLREFTPQDADALTQVLSDPETMRYYPAPCDRAAVEGWITRNIQRYQNDGAGLWALMLNTTQELIGDCGIILQQVDGQPLYEIGSTCAAISGDRAWPPKPPSLAAIGLLLTSKPTV